VTKTVVIHQPDFAPWLGFFHRLLSADLLVLLDTAQFVQGTSRAWTHRDKIKTPKGEAWLSISVARAPLGTAIRDIKLSQEVDWKARNLNLIGQNYRAAAFHDEILPLVEGAYQVETDSLCDFNINFLRMIMSALGLEVAMTRSSELDPQGSSNDMLVDILRKVGATRYLSGVGARAYFRPEPFDSAGIEVVWQDFHHPVYPQQFGPFIPGLSAIDLLFNCGLQGAREVLRSTAR
jgi:hypothetical protein